MFQALDRNKLLGDTIHLVVKSYKYTTDNSFTDRKVSYSNGIGIQTIGYHFLVMMVPCGILIIVLHLCSDTGIPMGSR
uniref:Uncharacterized protein n=1 Tax=Rhizophagus irregularis (strain DAOM 181602 / DAOM 197198 / MUCL 43194) TaxID=747089 RepID=U9U5Q3_RHIID